MLVSVQSWLRVCLLSIVAISCNPPQKEGFSSKTAVRIDLDAIRKRGYLNALVDNNSISYFIYKGKPMGYEYELLQLLAKELNVSLKIKVTSGVETAIDQLNKGEGDIIAFPMTINKPRKEWIAFTRPLFNTYQVLVQRKPGNWRKLNEDQINDSVIRTPTELGGKEVYVIKGTSHEMRMHNLSEEIGTDILIREDSVTTESEALIRKVSVGEIDYTVADHAIAQVNAAYYPNLDVKTVLSVPQQIAWGVRKNSPALLQFADAWLGRIKKQPTFMVIYNRYFKSPRTSLVRMKSDYFSYGSNRLSPYDDLIKAGAKELRWDWRLLASVVYQESKFNPDDESWAGARGLMQLMPETAKRFGAQDPTDPRQSLYAGVRYLKYLDRYWSKSVSDSVQRLKFVLASYNAGLSHVQDAKKLLLKYGKDKDVSLWDDNVQVYLLKKSESKFYRDPVVSAGYCKCEEPVNYIQDVFDRYEEYRTHIKNDLFDESAIQHAVTSN